MARLNRISAYIGAFPALATFLLCCIYSAGLPESVYVVDDRSLLDTPLLRASMDFEWWRTLFHPGWHLDFYPVRDLTYWIDFHILGASSTLESGTEFRLQNFFWMGVAATFLTQFYVKKNDDRLLCALLAITWLLHPMHAETLMWISARKDVLAIAFFTIFLFALSVNPKKTAIVAHLAGLLSKASSILAPFALLAYSFLFQPRREKNWRRLVLLSVCCAISLLSVYLQTKLYSDANDMRFEYTWLYRIQGSITALGRAVSGIFLPNVTAIDVENWGEWVSYNRPYFLPGIASFLALISWSAVALRNYLRRGYDLDSTLLYLGLFWATYLPISGLIFPHRNFYSIRYFEIPFLVLTIWASLFLMKRVSAGRLKRGLHFLSAILLFASVIESSNWSSALAPYEKALALNPESPALNRAVLNQIDIDDRWGRTGAEEKALKLRVTKTLKEKCGPGASAESFRNGHLCLWVWFQERFEKDRLALPVDSLKLMIQSTESVSPALKSKIENRFSRTQDEGFTGSIATPQQRVAAILELCHREGEPASRLKTAEWKKRHLLDRVSITEELAFISKRNLYGCFQ